MSDLVEQNIKTFKSILCRSMQDKNSTTIQTISFICCRLQKSSWESSLEGKLSSSQIF